MVNLRDTLPVGCETIGVDGAERADPARQGPVASRYPIGNGNALAAFHQRQNVAPAHPYRVYRSHGRVSLKRPIPWEALEGVLLTPKFVCPARATLPDHR